MSEIFIKQIKVSNVRNIKNLSITLGANKRQHLILTGKNGSGKTSLLGTISYALQNATRRINNVKLLRSAIKEKKNLEKQLIDNPSIGKHFGIDALIDSRKEQIGQLEFELEQPTIVRVSNSNELEKQRITGHFIIAFFGSKRQASFKEPKGINKIELKASYDGSEKPGQEFVQYLVNLKADRSFAKDDEEYNIVSEIDDWFENFENQLFKILDSKSAKLQFDRKKYDFNILEEGKLPYNFNQLSDGFSAILTIVSEIMMRMQLNVIKMYDVQGVVFIDEIETHLHVDLQKKILPFLTSFFPNIQFIVTTHSPFVISSIQDCIICDLEKKIITNDLSGYSYDTLIESYFGLDNYSYILQNYVAEYENLIDKEELTELQKDRLIELRRYIKDIPKFISDELAVKIQQIRLKELDKNIMK